MDDLSFPAAPSAHVGESVRIVFLSALFHRKLSLKPSRQRNEITPMLPRRRQGLGEFDISAITCGPKSSTIHGPDPAPPLHLAAARSGPWSPIGPGAKRDEASAGGRWPEREGQAGR
jgi:hypothetical protein